MGKLLINDKYTDHAQHVMDPRRKLQNMEVELEK